MVFCPVWLAPAAITSCQNKKLKEQIYFLTDLEDGKVEVKVLVELVSGEGLLAGLLPAYFSCPCGAGIDGDRDGA